VTIALLKSDADAARLEREWKMVLDAIPRAEGTIERHGRAVAHWWGEPPPKERATVAACLAIAFAPPGPSALARLLSAGGRGG
jgi:hypothetical protein